MDIKQANLEEIIQSESSMIYKAKDTYGKFFINAIESNNLLNNFIKSIDDIEKHISFAFLSQIEKHHTLALFSAVRRHHIQTDMNLRQVLESGVRMAYAMGNKEKEKFYEKVGNGTIEVPKKLKKASYDRIKREFKDGSDYIKTLKELINQTTAHSNIVYAFQNFKTNVENGVFSFSFFDDFDELKVKIDLRLIGSIAQGLLDLFYGINQKYKVFQFTDNFITRLKIIEKENNELKNELINNNRIKKYLTTD